MSDDDVEIGKKAENQEGGGEAKDRTAAFERSLYGKLWQMGAVAAVGVAAGALIATEFATIVIVMSVFSAIGAGAVFYFQGQLEDTDSLRKVMNEVRGYANELSEANTVLVSNNDKLEEALGPLKDTQEKLAIIAEKNGSDVQKLQKLVRENARCIFETQCVMKSDVKHTLYGVVFDADQNEDGAFSDKEIRRLLTRFKNIPGVVLKEKLFQKKVKRNKTVNAVLEIVATIHDDKIPKKKKIIRVDEAKYEIPDDDSW